MRNADLVFQISNFKFQMNESFYISVDLGAGSGRVFLCGCAENEFLLEEIHRFTYPPKEENGHLRWDFSLIFENIKLGLKKSGERAKSLNRKITSLGVDSWGVDYGLIEANGNLLANPICYRDSRTDEAQERVFKIITKEAIFDKTGIQFLNFNTIFQLCSEANLGETETILLLPDLINYFLTGKKFAEYTNATTTQLVNAKTNDWDVKLLETLSLDKNKFPKIISAGTDLGLLKTDIATELGLQNVRVIAPATHDTGSAVIGLPLEENWAFISSGTWSLVGVEQAKPLINNEVEKFNFTNEGGAYNTTRFLKNVMGLWILESCRNEWKAKGIDTDYETLLSQVAEIKGCCGFIYPDDERFINPKSMLRAIRKQQRETKQEIYSETVLVTKIILDSLAFRYASVLNTIEHLTNKNIVGIQIAGGGGKNNYLNQKTANACNKKVKAGLVEATVTGNILVQAIASGRFTDLAEARNYVARNSELKTFEPKLTKNNVEEKAKYLEIERRF